MGFDILATALDDTNYTLCENSPHSQFFWSVLSRTRTEYGKILRISPYSVRMREDMDQKHSEYELFSRSDNQRYEYHSY